VSVLVLVVDDEPDVEALFRQQFRRDLRAQRFVMDFANSAADALARVASSIGQSLILILSDINMPGMTGLEMLPKVKEIHRGWRCDELWRQHSRFLPPCWPLRRPDSQG
jgi:CheY-like chemotaxis protein